MRLQPCYPNSTMCFASGSATIRQVPVTPLSVTLKPGAVPIRCKQPRYPPLHPQFLAKRMDSLVEFGLMRVNPHSLCPSKAMVRAKPNGRAYRQVSDLRRVNDLTIPIAWPANDMIASAGRLAGSSIFSICDADGAFLQHPLAPESQEVFSVMTDKGVYTPTVLMQGQIDATAVFQASMQEIFGELVQTSLDINIDDALAHSPTLDHHLRLLRDIFTRARPTRLKLALCKCRFFMEETKWCGKIYSSSGVRHDPDRIGALTSMNPPATAGDLQQVSCALGWLRNHVPHYAARIAPLQSILKLLLAQTTRRTRMQACEIRIGPLWTDEQQQCVDAIQAALGEVATLAHLRHGSDVHLFADASHWHWAAVITHTERLEAQVDVQLRAHEPLAFVSGSFTGSQLNWPIIEKEACAIVETIRRCDYLLLRSGGFRIHTDHRSLMYVFHATGAGVTTSSIGSPGGPRYCQRINTKSTRSMETRTSSRTCSRDGRVLRVPERVELETQPWSITIRWTRLALSSGLASLKSSRHNSHLCRISRRTFVRVPMVFCATTPGKYGSHRQPRHCACACASLHTWGRPVTEAQNPPSIIWADTFGRTNSST